MYGMYTLLFHGFLICPSFWTSFQVVHQILSCTIDCIMCLKHPQCNFNTRNGLLTSSFVTNANTCVSCMSCDTFIFACSENSSCVMWFFNFIMRFLLCILREKCKIWGQGKTSNQGFDMSHTSQTFQLVFGRLHGCHETLRVLPNNVNDIVWIIGLKIV